MNEEVMNQENEVGGTEQNYITVIQEMKQNSVSKDEYNKVVQENKELLNTLISGGTIEVEKPDTVIDYKARGNDLIFGGHKKTNLEYVQEALAIREAGLKQGVNVNMPFGPKAEYTENDEEQTKYIAEKLQKLVDMADGDPIAFNYMLERNLVDNVPVRKNTLRR